MIVVWTKEVITKQTGILFKSKELTVEIDTDECSINFMPTTGRDIESTAQFDSWVNELVSTLPEECAYYVERYKAAIFPPFESVRRVVTSATATHESPSLRKVGNRLSATCFDKDSVMVSDSSYAITWCSYLNWQLCTPITTKAHESEGI